MLQTKLDRRQGIPLMYRIAICRRRPCSLIATAGGAAQNGAPDSEGGRYSFNRVDDGYLRLDQQHRPGLALQPPQPSAGPAIRSRTSGRRWKRKSRGCRSDNAALKKEMLARGIALPGMNQPRRPRPEPKVRAGLKVPSDAEIDRVMAVMEKMWKPPGRYGPALAAERR